MKYKEYNLQKEGIDMDTIFEERLQTRRLIFEMLRNSIESDLEYVNSSLQLWTKHSDERMIRLFRQRQERLYRELKYCILKFNRE